MLCDYSEFCGLSFCVTFCLTICKTRYCVFARGYLQTRFRETT